MAYSNDDKRRFFAKMRDVRWQKKRLEILARDEWTCQSCFASIEDSEQEPAEGLEMHVHHLWYEGESPWDTPNEGLITLCKDCHNEESKIAFGERRAFLEAFRRNGWLANQFNEVACDVYHNAPLHHVPEVEAAILAAAYRVPEIRKALVDAYWTYVCARNEDRRRRQEEEPTSGANEIE